MARGEGEREEAWPEEDPPLLNWWGTLKGSKSKMVAGREVMTGGEGGQGGERVAGAERTTEDSVSMVMAGLD